MYTSSSSVGRGKSGAPSTMESHLCKLLVWWKRREVKRSHVVKLYKIVQTLKIVESFDVGGPFLLLDISEFYLGLRLIR